VRNGSADGLQRFKCRGCCKTFNALTGTHLSRLRHKGKWLDQTGVLADGLTVHRAAERLKAPGPLEAFLSSTPNLIINLVINLSE
jgi:transposase-like protein